MELTQITNKYDGTVQKETFTVSENDYDVLCRVWLASDKTVIREWTVNEYINHNPHQMIILPFQIGGSTINVEAHCEELRQVFATKDGKRCASFVETFTYLQNGKR